MPASLLLYLAEASFCLALFALAYRLLLARLTYFAGNRAYLLGALAAALLLPRLAPPGLSGLLAGPAAGTANPLPFQLNPVLTRPAAAGAAAPGAAPRDAVALALLALLGVYLIGMLYKLGRLARHLWVLRQLARRHPSIEHGAFALVQLPGPGLPAFSFGRRIFLSPPHAQLSPTERDLLLQHEQVHIRQKHSLDLLFAEVLGALFWFNGLLPYYSRQLKAVHEFLADEAVTRRLASPTPYGELLIKLASRQPPFALVHTFSNQQIFQRILMLTQPHSSSMQKLRFLLVLPVVALAWAGTACTGSPATEAVAPAETTASLAPSAPAAGRIGRISWHGNRVLSTAELNEALGLKAGDVYDSVSLAQHLGNDPKGRDITSRYMDQGYLFFSVTPLITRQTDGTTDLTITISEGRKAQIGSITLTGNTKTPTADLLKLIPLRSGDVFSRAKVLETQRILARQGQFDPGMVGVLPRPVMRPNQPTDLVDIELALVEM